MEELPRGWDPFMHLPQPASVFRQYLGLADDEELPAYVWPMYLRDETPRQGQD